MRFEIDVNIRATPDVVWQFITDARAMGGCVAGLESLDVVESGRFLATLVVPVGQVRLPCAAEGAWLDRTAPWQAALQVRVAVGPPTAIQGAEHQIVAHNRMHLVNGTAGVTRMQWRMDVHLWGNYAGIPPHLLHPIIQKQSLSFFTCLKHQIENQAIPAKPHPNV